MDDLITDPSDPRIADYRNLSNADLIRHRGVFIAEGRLVVRRLLTESSYRTQSVLVTPAARESLDDVLAGRAFPTFVCSLELLKQITGFNLHRGCRAIGERPELIDPRTYVAGDGPIVALDGVGNADNIGLIFRNAAAFAARAVVLGPGCCDPLYRKAIRSSMAAALMVPFAWVARWPAFLQELRAAQWTVMAMTPDPSAVDINAMDARRGRIAILLGSEGLGLSESALSNADVRVRIPMHAGTDSLNVAVAAAIALFALTRHDG